MTASSGWPARWPTWPARACWMRSPCWKPCSTARRKRWSCEPFPPTENTRPLSPAALCCQRRRATYFARFTPVSAGPCAGLPPARPQHGGVFSSLRISSDTSDTSRRCLAYSLMVLYTRRYTASGVEGAVHVRPKRPSRRPGARPPQFGADTVDMDQIQIHPTVYQHRCPDHRGPARRRCCADQRRGQALHRRSGHP